MTMPVRPFDSKGAASIAALANVTCSASSSSHHHNNNNKGFGGNFPQMGDIRRPGYLPPFRPLSIYFYFVPHIQGYPFWEFQPVKEGGYDTCTMCSVWKLNGSKSNAAKTPLIVGKLPVHQCNVSKQVDRWRLRRKGERSPRRRHCTAGKKDHSTYMKSHAMLPVLTDRPLFLLRPQTWCLRHLWYQRWLQYRQTGTYLRLVKFYMWGSNTFLAPLYRSSSVEFIWPLLYKSFYVTQFILETAFHHLR